MGSAPTKHRCGDCHQRDQLWQQRQLRLARVWTGLNRCYDAIVTNNIGRFREYFDNLKSDIAHDAQIHGRSLLCWAIHYDRLEFIQYMMVMGAEVSEQALLYAVGSDRIPAMRLMSASMPAPIIDDTVLLSCLRQNRLEMLRLLMERENQNQHDWLELVRLSLQQMPMQVQVQVQVLMPSTGACSSDVLQLLLTRIEPGTVSAPDLLHHIIVSGRYGLAKIVLERFHVDVNIADSYGRKPLKLALELQYEEIIVLLLKSGAIWDGSEELITVAAVFGLKLVVKYLTEPK